MLAVTDVAVKRDAKDLDGQGVRTAEPPTLKRKSSGGVTRRWSWPKI